MNQHVTSAAAIWGRSSPRGQEKLVLFERAEGFPGKAVTDDPDIYAEFLRQEAAAMAGITLSHLVDRNGKHFWLTDAHGFETIYASALITGTAAYLPCYALDPSESDGSRLVSTRGEDGLSRHSHTLRSWDYSPQSTAYWLKDDGGQYFTLTRNKAH